MTAVATLLHRVSSPITFKIATEREELEQVHRLNYRTFVEEIPQHRRNEAQHQLYHGLHQWNLDCVDGRLVIWNPKARHDVHEHFAGRADCRTEDVLDLVAGILDFISPTAEEPDRPQKLLALLDALVNHPSMTAVYGTTAQMPIEDMLAFANLLSDQMAALPTNTFWTLRTYSGTVWGGGAGCATCNAGNNGAYRFVSRPRPMTAVGSELARSTTSTSTPTARGARRTRSPTRPSRRAATTRDWSRSC